MDLRVLSSGSLTGGDAQLKAKAAFLSVSQHLKEAWQSATNLQQQASRRSDRLGEVPCSASHKAPLNMESLVAKACVYIIIYGHVYVIVYLEKYIRIHINICHAYVRLYRAYIG